MKKQLEKIRNRIEKAASECGRDPALIRLVAVTKTVSVQKIKEAIDAGADIFGENYVQEAREKINALSSCPVSWHFIGHLQSNKAKYVVKLFDLIHSVDSIRLAAEIDKQAKKINKTQNILVQVNLAGEKQKGGVTPEEAFDLIKKAGGFKNISIRGLMTMPPYFNAPEKVRPYFKQLRLLSEKLKTYFENDPYADRISLEELSMGMTGDFEVAIQEGATMVRIGTALFGERD